MPPNLRNSKEWIVPVVCIAIVVAIVLIGQFSNNKQAKLDDKLTTTPNIEWPSQQVRRETIKESNKQFEITAYYPVTQDEAITATLRDFVTGEIAAFKQSVTEAGELPDGYPPATIDVSYEDRKSERAHTYAFTIYTDTGGAHGLSVTRTFSFTKAGQRIGLADLFTNGITGLGVVADYAQAELMKREFADAAWIKEGAAPSVENYQSFIVEDNGITIIFDPYQVAAYAAGTQMVSVPTTVFRRIANPEYFGTIQ